MDIGIVAIGRMKEGPERELCRRYLDRAQKSGLSLGFRGFDVREVPESKAGRAQERMAQEADAVSARVQEPAQLFCLDASGEMLDSALLAKRLERLAGAGNPKLIFVIGGADGIAPTLKTRADGLLSFGRATWPHQLARILLAEQLYRAMTILSGHPYHRA